ILGEEEKLQAEIIEKINKVLDIPIDELRQIIDENPASQYKVIARKVNIITKEALEAEKAKHVYFEEDTQRKYPGGDLAASLIGFIQGDSAWGLEKKYDLQLKGEEGRELRIFDANNNAVTEKIDPIKGNTVVTTIDLVIQQEAQKLVAKYAEISLAKRASLIVADPNTGEILAMAEYPSFDLNDPFNPEKINSEYHKNMILALPEDEQLNEMYKICRNFSVVDTFECGSIYKPLVYAAAIEEGIISEYDTFYCGGVKDIYGTKVPCWHLAGHGHQNYREAIANSCNVAVMEVVERLGREKYYKYQCDYGIGGSTGIDVPGEPNTERLVHGLAGLGPVELAVSSMGQGLNTTAVQMVAAFSSLINGGNMMKPYVVSQVIDENGNIVLENSPTVVRKVISKETSEVMKQTMVEVLVTGTGKKAAIPGYKIGGKTGTGQQGDKSDPDNNDIALTLMTYFPVDNPEYILMAVIYLPENYEDGNAQTLPMVKDMMNFIITQKHIPADDQTIANESLEENAVNIENYEGLNIAEVTNKLNYYGFSYDISGSGDVVKTQFPSGGSKVTKGSRIYLTATESGGETPLTLVPNIMGMTEIQAVETVTNVGFVPIVVNGSADEEVSEETPPISSENTENPSAEIQPAPVKTVTNQLPKYEIKLPKNTEILIYLE
ncbi:PASTA domain-containing protein, partial [Tyzzerella sp. OttesenSCG-928-J15]|nr:PASTA domain-containing protein [Tyzzerella sp. OttesenSCG-928-J15]MDL2248314.1 PASTA domain-containing protein [Tyzzerella sp. OttesenSCG-928-J15]